MPPNEPLLIVGASARAAAFSALRSRMRPICADLFADADLAARSAVRRVEPRDYPRGFLILPELRAPGPWMYTGGLENRPELVAEMSRHRQPLWGNSASVLRRVRSPFAVRDVLSDNGLACPALCPADVTPAADRRWLTKPLAGAGGTGIRFWDAAPPRRSCYYQEFLEGESCAAIYLGDGQSARLLGVTRQLVGESWLHSAPFHYCGSVGPLALDAASKEVFTDIGIALAKGFGLKGLFGVDCILRDSVPYPVEVNPRYTASIEVLEYASGLRALALHQLVFSASGGRQPPDANDQGADAPRSPIVGKAILFARASLRFPERGTWRSWTTAFPGVDILPTFADVPHPGTVIEAGRPILTLFRRAPTVPECIKQLQGLAADLDRWLFAG